MGQASVLPQVHSLGRRVEQGLCGPWPHFQHAHRDNSQCGVESPLHPALLEREMEKWDLPHHPFCRLGWSAGIYSLLWQNEWQYISMDTRDPNISPETHQELGTATPELCPSPAMELSWHLPLHLMVSVQSWRWRIPTDGYWQSLLRGKKHFCVWNQEPAAAQKQDKDGPTVGGGRWSPRVALSSRQIPVAHVLLSSRQITDNTLFIGMHLALCNAWLKNSSSKKKRKRPEKKILAFSFWVLALLHPQGLARCVSSIIIKQVLMEEFYLPSLKKKERNP